MRLGRVLSAFTRNRCIASPPMPCPTIAELLHDLSVQADTGNPEDPENQRSSWFSNPGASATAAPVRSGVGKYIAAAVLDAPVGSKAAAAAATESAGNGSAAEPAVKKQKVVPKPMSNFDAW